MNVINAYFADLVPVFCGRNIQSPCLIPALAKVHCKELENHSFFGQCWKTCEGHKYNPSFLSKITQFTKEREQPIIQAYDNSE
jgi:hypothetical protein